MPEMTQTVGDVAWMSERVSGESSCSNIRPDIGLYASISACSGQPSADIRSLAAGAGQARDASATRPTDRPMD